MSIEAKPLHSVGVSMKRKEDPRFIQGKGHYVDDLSLSGHALPLAGAQHVSARRDQEHRHQRSDEGARRQGGDHGQGSRSRGPRVAADLSRVRQADGARDRQGALPVSGSRRRVRRDARGGGRWRRGGAGRLRAAARRRRSVHVEDRQGAAAPGPREQDESHLPLGSGRQGRHRARDGVERQDASSSASGSSAVIRRRSSRAGASRTSTRWGVCSST